MNPKEEAYLISLREDLKVVGDYIKEVSEGVLENKISKYPIFVAHNQPTLPIGKAIVDSEKTKTNWSFNASLLEELFTKQVVTKEKIEPFKTAFKDPKEFACFFLLTNDVQNFVFVPYAGE